MELLLIILLPLLGAILPPLAERFGRNLCAAAAPRLANSWTMHPRGQWRW